MAEQTAPRTATQGRLEQARRDRDAFMAGPTFAFYEEWIAEEIRLIEASAAIESEAAASPAAPAVDVERLPVGVSDGLASPCEDCGDHPRFDYIVDDDFWRHWVTGRARLGVVCLPCLDRRCGGVGLAEALGRVDWTGTGHTVSLQPSGRYSHDLTLHAEYARLQDTVDPVAT